MAQLGNDITAAWLANVEKVLSSRAEYLTSSGRKYISPFEMFIPIKAWNRGCSHTMEDLLYSKKTKFNQLDRNYYNGNAIVAAENKLVARYEKKSDFTSVAVSMFGGDKDGRSQGHCMNSIVVTYIHKNSEGKPWACIDIFYRQTEIIKKFGADLVYLREIVIPSIVPPEIMEHVEYVRFRFANVFFSALFIPIIYKFIPPERLWSLIKENHDDEIPQERSFKKSTIRYIFWPLDEPDPLKYNFKSRQKMHRLSLRYMEEGVVNREKLTEIYMDIKAGK